MAMYCPHCGAQTDENDKFCVICGELVHATAVCGACGEVIPMAAAFCPACGVNFLEHPELSLQGAQPMQGRGIVSKPIEEPLETEEPDQEGVSVEQEGQSGDEMDAGQEFEDDGGPMSARTGPRLPRALKIALGMKEGNDGDAEKLEAQQDEEPEPQQESEQPDDEGGDSEPEESDDEPASRKRKGKFSLRRKRKRALREERPMREEAPGDAAGSDEDSTPAEGDGTPRLSLIQRLRKKKDGEGEGKGIFARLLARFRKHDDGTEYDDEDEDVEQDGEDNEEENLSKEPKAKKTGFFARRKKEKKANVAEAEALKEFAEKANYDGYYDDVHPLDYGENEEEHGQLDIKAIVLLVLGLIIFCVVVIKLQSML